MQATFFLQDKAIVVTGSTDILGEASVWGIVEAACQQVPAAHGRVDGLLVHGAGGNAAAGGGSIVNSPSMMAQRAATKVLGYSMGQMAVDCYSRWMAVEMVNRYGDKLRMNALAPGFFLTEQNRTLLTTPTGDYTGRGEQVIRQTPFSRFGQPDELQGALVWLLSDASACVTGSVICVDGGFSTFGGV